jgi:hypothetical protein
MNDGARASLDTTIRRCFLGAGGFAFVVTFVTVGAGTAFAALAVGLAATHLPRQAVFGRWASSAAHARRKRTPRTRRAPAEYELVPDDPSLILTMGS